jgi:hypothetical protein
MKLNRRDLLRAASGLAAAGLQRASADVSAPAQEVSSASGFKVSVFGDGTYRIAASQYGWIFGGALGRTIENISVSNGTDLAGAWQEIGFNYEPARSSSIRLYDRQSTVLFSTTYGADSSNNDPFPRFTSFPQGLSTFSYSTLWSYKFGFLNRNSPWLFFDGQANAVLLSPAANFMTAVSQVASDGAIEATIDGRIGTLPAGFTHRTILALAPGINAAFEQWGRTLTGLSGKNRPASDAIPLLNRLSYWTDAGSAYYYHPSDESQYVPILLQVPSDFSSSSTPIGSVELDSWHYPKGTPASWKNNGSGMDTFQADPAIFLNGLAAFQNALGVPLATHARWIDANSPLRGQYKMSGNVSIDPQYWKDYASYLSGSGVEVLEQDWLSGPAVADFNLTDPDAFLDNMASAMHDASIKIVYCMPLWTHILQSSKYDNVVAARVSNDAFSRSRWDELIFNSRIASAMGLWPFADAFTSKNVKDVLLATLTAGPIGSGDALGSTIGPNLSRAIRPDGVIVKPDVPIAPTDSTFVGLSASQVAPVVAFTYTDHAALRTGYVFAYDRVQGAQSPISFSPQSLGVAAPAFVFHYFTRTGLVLEPGQAFTGSVDYNGSYLIVAPVGTSGIAFLGDAGKFVSCGKKRIEQISDDGVLRVSVRFAAGEKRVALRLYSPFQPIAAAEAGSMGPLIPDKAGTYRVVVSPDASGQAMVNFRIGPDQYGNVPI